MALNTFCSTNLAAALSDEQEPEELWTTARVAQMLNRPERSVRRMVQRGEINGFKVRGRFGEEWRIVPFNILDTRSAKHDHDSDDDDNNSGNGSQSDGSKKNPVDKQRESCPKQCEILNFEVPTDTFGAKFGTQSEGEIERCNASIQAPCKSAWQFLLTYFRSLLVWFSKNGKASSSVVEY